MTFSLEEAERQAEMDRQAREGELESPETRHNRLLQSVVKGISEYTKQYNDF